MNHEPQRVWLVIVNWQNGPDTVECLDSILNVSRDDVAGIVVCDNNSHDDSVACCRAWAVHHSIALPEYRWLGDSFELMESESAVPNITHQPILALVQTGRNGGFAYGNNIGIRFIQTFYRYDYLLLLNNDALLTRGAVPKMVSRLRRDDRLGMCGCTVIYHHTPTRVQAQGGATYSKWLGRSRHISANSLVTNPRSGLWVESQLDYILGAALMISRKCIDKVGLMEESYFLYYEEIDWATRARRCGFTLGYAADAEILHKEGRSIGSSATTSQRSLLSEYYLLRSRISFSFRFHPYCLPTVICFSLVQALRPLLQGDFARSRARLTGLFHLPYKKMP